MTRMSSFHLVTDVRVRVYHLSFSSLFLNSVCLYVYLMVCGMLFTVHKSPEKKLTNFRQRDENYHENVTDETDVDKNLTNTLCTAI